MQAEDDAQRALEQRALGNVARLAEKLGYGDAFDKRREKATLLLMIGGTLALVAALVVAARIHSSHDAEDLARQRCVVQFRVDNVDRLRYSLMQERPELTPVQRSQLLEERLGPAAMAQCAGTR